MICAIKTLFLWYTVGATIIWTPRVFACEQVMQNWCILFPQHSILHDLFTIGFNGKTLGVRKLLATAVHSTASFKERGSSTTCLTQAHRDQIAGMLLVRQKQATAQCILGFTVFSIWLCRTSWKGSYVRENQPPSQCDTRKQPNLKNGIGFYCRKSIVSLHPSPVCAKLLWEAVEGQ